jgi:hypothetical protein
MLYIPIPEGELGAALAWVGDLLGLSAAPASEAVAAAEGAAPEILEQIAQGKRASKTLCKR